MTPLMLLGVACLAALISISAPRDLNSILSFSLDLIPIAGAVAIAGIFAGDTALELQLSLPTSFRRTLARRAVLAAAIPLSMGAIVSSALAITSRLVWPVPPASNLATDLLIWIAPLLWLSAAAAAASLGLRATAASAGLIGATWLLEELLQGLFRDTPWLQPLWLFARYDASSDVLWYLNRMVLLLSGLALVGLAGWLAGRSERLLAGEG